MGPPQTKACCTCHDTGGVKIGSCWWIEDGFITFAAFRLGPVNEVVPHMAALAERCCAKWASQGQVKGLLAAKEYTFLVGGCFQLLDPGSPFRISLQNLTSKAADHGLSVS